MNLPAPDPSPSNRHGFAVVVNGAVWKVHRCGLNAVAQAASITPPPIYRLDSHATPTPAPGRVTVEALTSTGPYASGPVVYERAGVLA